MRVDRKLFFLTVGGLGWGGGMISENEVRDRLTVDGKLAYFTGAGGGGGLVKMK